MINSEVNISSDYFNYSGVRVKLIYYCGSKRMVKTVKLNAMNNLFRRKI